MHDEFKQMMCRFTRLMENLNFPTPDYDGSELMQRDLETADMITEILYQHYNIAEDDRISNPFTSCQ